MFQIIILFLWVTTTESIAEYPLAKLGCQEKCGDIVIPYPFGIGFNCSFAGFAVTCNESRKPFIKSINLEVRQISLEKGTVQVYNPVITADCHNRANGGDVNLTGTRFWFSDTDNRFTASGCNNLALINRNDTIITGCMSLCIGRSSSRTTCYGIDCCQTTIPYPLRFINASLSSPDPKKGKQNCKYAFMVDYQWFNDTDIFAARNRGYVPAVLDWAYGWRCNNANRSSCGANAYCLNKANNWMRNQCFCYSGYEGNPYLPSGCQECSNAPGGNNCGKLPNNSNSRTKVIIAGTCSGLGVLLLLICFWLLWREVIKRKEAKLKEKFFKRNGGLLLHQQLSSNKGTFETTKLFTSKELEKATDNYNANRILGQGGQGTVYKGMLTDGRIVAVKKSKVLDEDKLEEFINEVVILSKINHRNIVNLFGCCLETEVPMLVYEFIPNGTLFHYIHDQNEEFPLTWDLRLRIAAEIASALSYLHSAASIAIYHRDIKSTNILLDEKFRAKVSDFGISRSISVDKTHLTTAVQGTIGYLDPEYFQSSQFTEKSDVYSFGVVLVELLTGKRPILSAKSDEGGSLIAYFLLRMTENRLFDILDARVVKEGRKKEAIWAVATVAKRCLQLNGSSRPTMKEVLVELDGIRLSNGASAAGKQSCHDIECATDDLLTGPWEAAFTSTGSFYSTGGYPNSAV